MRGKHWRDGKYRPFIIDHDASLRPGAHVSLDTDGLHPTLANFNGGKVRKIRKRTFDGLNRLEFQDLKREFAKGFMSEGEIWRMLSYRDGIVKYFKNHKDRIINDNN